MSKANVISNETLVIEVEKKKSSAFGWIGRIFAILASSVLFLVGFLLCITIIGIIFGYPMIMFAAALFALGLGWYDVKCPHCEKRSSVIVNADNLKCKKCENLTIINWK